MGKLAIKEESLEAAKAAVKELPLDHYFTDGIYLRVITIPANMAVVGHLHKTNHYSVLLEGEMRVKVGVK